MGFFSRSKPQAEPVRESQVKAVNNAIRDLMDAEHVEDESGLPQHQRDVRRAESALKRARGNATKAELHEATRRR